MPAYFFSYTIAIPSNPKVHDVVVKTFDTYEEGVGQPSLKLLQLPIPVDMLFPVLCFSLRLSA
jgi:hypothetical protein